MSEQNYLENFFAAIQNDPRIGSAHISIYTTLFCLFTKNDGKNPVMADRAGIMKTAKIYGNATYHKCLKDLVHAGYIHYTPSFHPGIRSSFVIVNIVSEVV